MRADKMIIFVRFYIQCENVPQSTFYNKGVHPVHNLLIMGDLVSLLRNL